MFDYYILVLLTASFLGISAASVANPAKTSDIRYIASFSEATGGHPAEEPILASDGSYYGVLPDFALNGLGSVYKFDVNGTLSVVHAFGGSDGQRPMGRLLQASDGALYGTTFSGGQNSCGTIFKLSLDGGFSTVHTFNCGAGGSNPSGGLMQGEDGRLYGVTQSGGGSNHGIIFSLTLAGHFKHIATFKLRNTGAAPIGELVQAANGILFGITSAGGAYQGGTLYSTSLDGKIRRLVSFAEDDKPNSGLMLSSDRTEVYGTTGSRAVYKFKTKLRRGFRGVAPLPATPTGGLTLSGSGQTFYGFCSSAEGQGCVYTVNAQGSVSMYVTGLVSPAAGRPLVDNLGEIVGTTYSGGGENDGEIFIASSAKSSFWSQR